MSQSDRSAFFDAIGNAARARFTFAKLELVAEYLKSPQGRGASLTAYLDEQISEYNQVVLEARQEAADLFTQLDPGDLPAKWGEWADTLRSAGVKEISTTVVVLYVGGLVSRLADADKSLRTQDRKPVLDGIREDFLVVSTSRMDTERMNDEATERVLVELFESALSPSPTLAASAELAH